MPGTEKKERAGTETDSEPARAFGGNSVTRAQACNRELLWTAISAWRECASG
jgi:hypothetical protein